jgi:hypothetical protein
MLGSLVSLHYRKAAYGVPGLQIYFWTIENRCLKFKRKAAPSFSTRLLKIDLIKEW